ncbi:MAG TPA: c-type cytochrome [Bryobacteraceae bacterium]|nr:c-type cytochrome [Bryobacteraceae bacterium]
MKAIFSLAVALAATGAQAQVTFTKDVAPIFQNHCQVCHRPDTFAPMPLLTYEEARPWARSIRQKVLEREMPPWYIDKNVGIRDFKNDTSLTDQEIATIVAWVNAGAPKGDPKDMPAPRKFEDSDRWHIRPDLIVQLPKDEIVPAQSADRWVDILVDSGLKEDRYIQGIEIKPLKGFRAVHHATTSMKHDDDPDSGDNVQGVFLNEYALGKNADVFPDGAGRLIKAGTKFNFNLHLHATGQDTPVNIALALELYPQGYVPHYIETTEKIGDPKDLDLPPNTDNIRFDAYQTLTKPARLLSFQPHMHNRGKASCMEAIYPGGHKVETLSCVSKYQFNWHLVYLYREDEQPLLPPGTILHITSWYNNSANNRFNPDPDNTITYGQRTIDEMGGAWVSYYYLSDQEFQQQLAERKAKQQTVAGTR